MKDRENHIAPVPRTVISLQPVERAEKLRDALKDNGIKFFNIPMIRTETVEMQPEIRQILQNLEAFDLLIFTSRNGVKAFFKLLQQAGFPFPEKLNIAVIGKGTAEELTQFQQKADFIQPGNTSRDFATYLKKEVVQNNENILLALGNLASGFLQNELSTLASVQRINVYKTLPVKDYDTTILSDICQNRYGLLIVSSPSSFENFYKLYQKQQEKTEVPLRIVSIGETTTKAILHTTSQAMVRTANKPGTNGLLYEIKKFLI